MSAKLKLKMKAPSGSDSNPTTTEALFLTHMTIGARRADVNTPAAIPATTRQRFSVLLLWKVMEPTNGPTDQNSPLRNPNVKMRVNVFKLPNVVSFSNIATYPSNPLSLASYVGT